MRLLSFAVQTDLGRFSRLGALAHDTIVDLTSAYRAYLIESGDGGRTRELAEALLPPDMVGFLDGGAASRQAAEQAVAYADERLKSEPIPRGPDGERLTFAEREVRWLPPVPKPHMVRDGILTLEHYRKGLQRLLNLPDDWVPDETKQRPVFWKPSRAAIAAHKDPILWPGYTEQQDYEFEIGIYIGRSGKNIAAADATSYIAGYTLFNDLGCRDIQPGDLLLRMGPTKSKDFETSKIMGPYLVTPDEVPAIEDLVLEVRVNDEVWFRGKLGTLAFSFEEVIAFVSQEETLEVGDFFGSGPPAGSAGFEMGRWIKPGDTVSCTVESLGTLSNQVVRR
jgi:2-keto-4-pentenoate hydratase/2-oxohepta-3-ene-1,7-dioic acid hydratase in catechol pathway